MIVTLGTTPTIQRTMTFARVEIDGVNRAKSVRQFASGKSVNCARVLHTLGEEVLTTGLIGGDAGKFMRADLDAAAIAHDFVDTSPAETRLCLTVVDEAAGTATELVEESRPVEPRTCDALVAALERLLRAHDVSVLVLSGTLVSGAGDDFYAKCLTLANGANVRTILDARGEPLKLALSGHPTVVKPNRAELAATVGATIDSERALSEAIRSVVELGARWVVVTDGPRDTVVSDGLTFWRITPPKIDAVNPIGSGDSFAAGLASALRGGHEVPPAAALGTACAAGNALTMDAGHVRVEDVERLRAEVRIDVM